MSPSQEHVIVLVHGIRDFAAWQTVIRKTLEGAGFTVELTNYGRLDLIRFLAPIPYFRKTVVARVLNQIEQVQALHPAKQISFIAHSFGTYVLSEILKQRFRLVAHHVIFCGCVVRYDFPFEQVSARFTTPILNEIGTRDIWPAMAESVTFGYGSAGTYGFKRPFVRDRWHNGGKHGFFLTQEFCERFWIPFLRDGIRAEGDVPPEQPPWWIRLLYVIRIKYLVGIAAVSAVIAATMFVPAQQQVPSDTVTQNATLPNKIFACGISGYIDEEAIIDSIQEHLRVNYTVEKRKKQDGYELIARSKSMPRVVLYVVKLTRNVFSLEYLPPLPFGHPLSKADPIVFGPTNVAVIKLFESLAGTAANCRW